DHQGRQGRARGDPRGVLADRGARDERKDQIRKSRPRGSGKRTEQPRHLSDQDRERQGRPSERLTSSRASGGLPGGSTARRRLAGAGCVQTREGHVDQFLQHLLNAVMLGGTYALLGIGLTLIFGIMRVVNFAHGELYAFGAYTVYLVAAALGLNFFLGLVVAIIAG